MAKNGQTKVLSNNEFAAVLDEIEHHRYPAKNALIIQISFKLGHKSAATTTTIYQDVTEQEVREVSKKAGKNYDN